MFLKGERNEYIDNNKRKEKKGNRMKEEDKKKRVTAQQQDICQEKCQRYACAIQDCLSKNSYQEKRCKGAVARWKKCCEEARQRELAR